MGQKGLKEKEARKRNLTKRSKDVRAGPELIGQGLPKEGLRESEGKFRELAEKSLAGIYVIQDGVFKYCNPRFAQIFGYTVEEVTNKIGPRDMVLPEDWTTVDRNIRKRISGRADSIHYEFRGITKTGQPTNMEVYGSRIIYQGKPAVIGTMLDVTRRKHAERLSKEAEEKYRSIFENAMEGIFQITQQGRFIVMNPALERILGYGSPEELTGTLLDTKRQLYVEPDRRSEFMLLLERDGMVQGFECELYRKDRSTVWASMNARAVRDTGGTTLYYEGTVQDITEQKKSEDELRRLNQFNEVIIENAPVAVFTLDKDGLFTSVNPALAAISGLGAKAEEKLIGFNWLTNPYTIKCGLAEFIKKGLQGVPFQLWDFPFITYNGDRNLFMDFKGVPLRGKDGTVEGLLCIIEETTDRVKTRAKLMQEAQISAIGRLAAGIAHELNNPLATLVAHTELASTFLKRLSARDATKLDLDELKSCLNIVEAQAFRCKNVTNDILSLPWKEGFEITSVDINRLLNNILEFTQIEQSGGRIVTEFASALAPVKGDISALRQVFINLISNAIDAIDGRLDAGIWIRTKPDNSSVRVEIEDNGIGIPDTIVTKIFEPFFTTKQSKKGVGLGLSLCSEFLKNMGGTIHVESRPGYGTVFCVTLPT
jgi:two-component system cell cycle sensor histidine kinase/response regulator CckA